MSGETKKLGAGTTFLLGLLAFGFITYFARTSSASLGAWIVGLTGLAVVVVLVGKFLPQAPTFIRELSARCMRRPSLFFFWCVVVGGGGWTGRTIHDGHVQACTDGLAKFSSAKVDRSGSDRAALQQLESFTSGIKAARMPDRLSTDRSERERDAHA